MADRRGFTLVEAVMALTLAGLFAVGAVSTVRRLAPKFHLQAAIWEVTAGLNQARFQAIMSGTSVRVRFVPSGFVLERYHAAAASWREARAVHLPGVRVRANNAPIFHPQGTVSDLATISVGNARGTYRITVAITGRIRALRAG